MNVTKDVVIDLLPAYLPAKRRPDTCALIEEMAAKDPAVARLLDAARRDEPALRQPIVLPVNLERESVSRTRAALRWRGLLLGLAIACTAAVCDGVQRRSCDVRAVLRQAGVAIALAARAGILVCLLRARPPAARILKLLIVIVRPAGLNRSSEVQERARSENGSAGRPASAGRRSPPDRDEGRTLRAQRGSSLVPTPVVCAATRRPPNRPCRESPASSHPRDRREPPGLLNSCSRYGGSDCLVEVFPL